MNDVAVPRRAGSVQGLVLLLPISMTVATVVLFTASVALMTERFRAIAHADYLVQLVITIPAIGILLFAPLAGWLTDAIGRRRILVGSMLAYAVFGCAPYFLENIYAILLTRCALGVCVSAVVTASTTMISDYFKGRARERWFAAQAAVSAISAVVLIWVGGRLGASLGWRGPFLAYAYSIVLAIAIWVLTWEPSEESPEELTANEDVSYTEFPLARMLGICIVTLGASITFYAVSTQNANALVTLGVHDPAEIGRLSAVATFGTVLGTAAFGVLGRLPTAGLLTLDFALLGLGFVLMAASGSAQVYTMSAVVQQFGCGLVLPTLLVWATRGLAFRIRGRAIGMWQAAFQVGQLLSGITITFLAAHSAGLLAAFSTLGVACLGAAVVSGLAAFTLLRRSGRARASI
jgi:MFS family permease